MNCFPDPDKHYYMFYKPFGCVTAHRDDLFPVVMDYFSELHNDRLSPVGRLDRETEGLLIVTNDGDLINGMMRARYAHEKEYKVRVNKEVTPEFIEKMSRGVHIRDKEKNLDAVTRPCTVKKTGKYTFSIILTQGLNRQIRRMCEALGYKVDVLKRIRIMNVELGDLKPGQVRELTEQELKELYGTVKERENERTGQPSE